MEISYVCYAIMSGASSVLRQTKIKVSKSEKEQARIGHVVGTLKDQVIRKGDNLYRPFTNLKSADYKTAMAIHFLMTVVCTMFVTFGSMMTGAMFGTVSALPNTFEIGLAAIQVGFMHYILYTTLYYARVPGTVLVQVNPFVSLAELAHGAIGAWVMVVQIVGQALGHVIVAAIMLGIMRSGTELNNLGVTPLLQTGAISSAWAFFAQTLVSFFWAWYYFHNYNFRVREDVLQKEGYIYGPWADSRNFPDNMGRIKAACTVIMFPIYGITTQNIFRWVAGCVITPGGQQCTASGIWGEPVGSLVGITLGFMGHFVTWSLTGRFGARKFE